MENASKALIIAGAILISIMIIGLGVAIFSKAKSNINSQNLNSEVAQAQNEKFSSYIGDRMTASEVKSLMSVIRTNNITGASSDDIKTVYVSYEGKETDPAEVSSSVKAGKTYKVSIKNSKAVKDSDADKDPQSISDSTEAYYSNGYIRIIWIEMNGSGSNQ